MPHKVHELREEIVLTLPPSIIRKVAVIAAEKDTTVQELVQEFLQGLIDRDYISVVRTITAKGMRSDPPPPPKDTLS